MDKSSSLKRTCFLFVFFYFIIYICSSGLLVSKLLFPIYKAVVPPFASVLGHPGTIEIFTNGSGDTTFDYYQVLLISLLAILLAVIGNILIKHKKLPFLSDLLVVIVRYYVAFQMLMYGFIKIFYLQFFFPSMARLNQPLGDFSPMGLLWNFMGYSEGYVMFTGLMEAIGGLLLLFQRTTLLGALLVFGVMLNVVMLNFFYDVPVKLFSIHLLVMSLYLVMLSGRQLYHFFILHRSVSLKKLRDVVPSRFTKARNVAKYVVIVLFIAFLTFTNFTRRRYMQQLPKHVPMLYGIHEVEEFETLNGGEKSSNKSWKRIIQREYQKATVVMADSSEYKVIIRPDTIKHSVNIVKPHFYPFADFAYIKLDSRRYQMTGKYLGDSVRIVLRKSEEPTHLLVSRGFHWINEEPFNR